MNQEILDLINDQKLPTYDEIPDVGLYRDQVVKYINQYFIEFPDMFITGSMVSNYLKQGLLPKCEKKLYKREHIIRLFMIIFGKEILSTENLKQLFAMLDHKYNYEVAYNYFLLELENVVNYIMGVQDEMKLVGSTTSIEKTLLRNTIIAISHKLYITQNLKKIKEENE